MSNKSKVYLISGRTGAGKTALSRKIATEIGAFRISHDEWLRKLFGEEIDKERFREKCEKVSQLIWDQVESLSELGISIILEGWGSRGLRDKARRKLEEINLDYEFLYVDCPVNERWLRVQERNKSIGEEGFHISKEDFDRMEMIREEFDDDEPVTMIDNSMHNQSLVLTSLADARAAAQL